MGPGAVGISEEAARAFVARLGFEKTAQDHQLLVRRPGRVRESLRLDDADPVISEEDYTPGALAKLVMAKTGCAKMKVTVRTGREAYGRLPRAPECNERHFQAPNAKGAIMELLERAGRQEKTAQAHLAIQHEGVTPSGPWSSLVDNLKNTLLGAGAGRALLFLLAGKTPTGLERAVMAGGGIVGYGLGRKLRREAGEGFPLTQHALETHQRVMKAKPVMSLDEALKQLPPRDEDKEFKSDLRRDIVSAVAGGTAGALVPEIVGILRSRLARAARAI